ncbi:MAG TPA: dihydrolipoamide acetyltransferase family protein [Steroidobacteraceae bacterium]|nr:dihydrolipoamide acetyltransferase family protein [Steroidobacteraceae bacterium]
MTQVAQEIPKVGLVMEEVRVVRWLKSVGDTVVAGEPLLEVETEKAVVEIEAAATGRLSQILVQTDSRATVGDQVAWIESAEAQGATTAPHAADPKPADTMPAARMQGTTAFALRDAERDAARIRSTPIARKLAGEHGIDLGGITGTGPGGRVQLDDVQRAIGASLPADTGAQSLSPMPLSPMRRALARAMSLSNATIPQFGVTNSVDWTELQAMRGEFAASLPPAAPKLSVNDFLLQAVARTLIEFPALNATFSGDPESVDARIVPASGAHIGLVVAVDDGLLVPVIHDVEQLGLAEIARRREDCVERSLRGRLKRAEAGATISISNLGAEGPDRFTAIINPPQSAILAVGRRRDGVVAKEGAIVVRPLSELTLTVDHRVADGRLASRFLARLIAILEGRDWRLN